MNPEVNAQPMFTLSPPSSAASSRSPSPAPSVRRQQPQSMAALDQSSRRSLEGLGEQNGSLGWEKDEDLPGLRSMDAYEATLPWWRAAVRRQIVKNVKWESEVIAKIQDYIRTPWLDAYFLYTSSLGTHTFFMIMLPMMFFFGLEELGTGLVTVLAAGVYITSFIKDLICSPRPFAPPVTRLTIGSHHLEYGFPSTHSTNSVSMALFFFALIHQLASVPAASISNPIANPMANITSPLVPKTESMSTEPMLSPVAYSGLTILLILYGFSIVFGRIYTAMHSFIDCIAGIGLGTGIWWAQTSFPGFKLYLPSGSFVSHIAESANIGTLFDESGDRIIHLFAGLSLGERLESWVTTASYEVPLILIPLFLLSVNQHPQPVDDCPCFEDAIAFISVVFGVLIGRWGLGAWREGGLHTQSVMPGSGWMYDSAHGVWLATERNLGDILTWWGIAAIKVVVGVLTIFMWRILAKSLLHLILPPTFRFLSRLVFPFSLPHRRFYTPATDYTSVPSEFSGVHGGGEALGRAVPSVIDLPAMVELGEEKDEEGQGSGTSGNGGMASGNGAGVRARTTNNNGVEEKGRTMKTSPLGQYGDGVSFEESNGTLPERKPKDKYGEPVKHYDADVITKMIVYAGIAIITTEVMPAMFDLLGWGVKSWP